MHLAIRFTEKFTVIALAAGILFSTTSLFATGRLTRVPISVLLDETFKGRSVGCSLQPNGSAKPVLVQPQTGRTQLFTTYRKLRLSKVKTRFSATKYKKLKSHLNGTYKYFRSLCAAVGNTNVAPTPTPSPNPATPTPTPPSVNPREKAIQYFSGTFLWNRFRAFSSCEANGYQVPRFEGEYRVHVVYLPNATDPANPFDITIFDTHTNSVNITFSAHLSDDLSKLIARVNARLVFREFQVRPVDNQVVSITLYQNQYDRCEQLWEGQALRAR